MRIAIDAPPIQLYPPKDHGAMQLISFGALPPRKPKIVPLPNINIPSGCKIEVKDEGRRYILTPVNIDGLPNQKITGADYLRGLKYLAETDVFVKNLILNDVSLSLTSNNQAVIFLKENKQSFEDLLSSPAWLPLRQKSDLKSGKLPGLRQIRKMGENRWEAFCPDKKRSSIIVETLRDPEENIRLFEAGVLQQTADTATPTHKLPSKKGDRISRKTSMRAVLVFFGDLAENSNIAVRKRIVTSLKNTKCSEMVGWAKVSTPSDDPEPIDYRESFHKGIIPRNGITLAYDDYFPNATVAWSLSIILKKVGVSCIPIADNYIKPKINAPMRLMIVAGPTNSTWGRYASMSLCPVWRRDPFLMREYNNILNASIFDKSEQEKLDFLIKENAPFAMIGAIPSICFSSLASADL